MAGLKKRNPGELEFHQAVQELAETVMPTVLASPAYREAQILERMTEPERVIIFRVCWEDDKGNARVNRGYRIQFNSAIGPYKGGLRFHPSVSLSILKRGTRRSTGWLNGLRQRSERCRLPSGGRHHARLRAAVGAA